MSEISDSSVTAQVNESTHEDCMSTPEHHESTQDVPTQEDVPTPLQSSTPNRRKSKVVNRLRAKLRQAEEELEKNRKQLQNINRKFNRLKARRVSVNIPPATAAKNKKVRQQKGGISPHSKRKSLLKIVHAFLHRDDVSTVVNGKSGEIRRRGVIHRKRHLCDTMANLHKRFCNENPHQKVSKAQFFKLRPFWIVRPKIADRDTCACKLHENFNFKIKKLHQLGVIESSCAGDVVQWVVCNTNNIDCMYKRCAACKDREFPTAVDQDNKGNIITWQEWVTRTITVQTTGKAATREKEVKNTALETRSTSIERLVAVTKEQLPNFAAHIFNIRHQFSALKTMKEGIHDDDVMVHIDYSENWSCKYAREVKDTHFGGGNQQVTLHTGVFYNSKGRAEAFASVSASLQHDATATWAHLEPVLKYIRQKHVRHIHFVSDGPTSQYRNKTSFYLASTVPFLHGFKYVTWNFTEASHGKGAPDGVGAALKNLADRIVAYGQSIPDADTLFQQLTLNSSVTLFQVCMCVCVLTMFQVILYIVDCLVEYSFKLL